MPLTIPGHPQLINFHPHPELLTASSWRDANKTWPSNIISVSSPELSGSYPSCCRRCRPHQIRSKIFQIKYQNNLSSTAKAILNSFQNKYVYYAFDDILYSFKLNPLERDNLLAVLYSPILSLQNNFSVNFFDIWIRDVYIDEISKTNKFLSNKSQTLKQCNSITIQFFYKTCVPVKKQKSLW